LTSSDDLERLRKLLLTPEQERIEAIDQRLEDRERRVSDVVEALPEAVDRDDPRTARAFTPLIERGLRESVRKNPQVVVDVIYPILGPMIRKAVASAVRGMVESFNRVTEQSFTARGLKWRWQAFRTGRPVAEIAMEESLVYRVEQVFLIHRETGILLEAAAQEETARDEDLMSGMLTAIQDFVRDSFSVERTQELDRLEVGDFQVWIERGPRAVLAAVIRGAAPRRVRAVINDALGDIHADYGEELSAFSGDPEPFEATQPRLQACLEQELLPRAQKTPLIVWFGAAALIGLLGYWAVNRWQDRSEWRAYLAALEEEPGIVVVESGRRDGRRTATLLADPLARDPSDLLRISEVAADIELDVRHYLSLESEIAAMRARQEAEALKGKIEAIRIDFASGESEFAGEQDAVLAAAATWLATLKDQAAQSRLRWSARVVGSTDEVGDEQTNQTLRQERADAVRARLVRFGAPPELTSEAAATDQGRQVRIEVALEPDPAGGGE